MASRLFLALMLALGPSCYRHDAPPLRIATFNLRDLRSVDFETQPQPRLDAIVNVIAELNPDVLLLTELHTEGDKNTNALLSRLRSRAPSLSFVSYTPANNNGVHSGFDLDNSGRIVRDTVEIPESGPDGLPRSLGSRALEYRGDASGFGTFPGQYGMALLVRGDIEILRDRIRTFARFCWRDMPRAKQPPGGSVGREFWYTDEAWENMPLSTRNHVDVPIRLEADLAIHLLCSNPVRARDDGDEGRNRRRNHNEIRFWSDYIGGEPWIYDDRDEVGGLPQDALFVLIGDLNADPERPSEIGNAVRHLLAHPRMSTEPAPSWGDQETDSSLAKTATTEWAARQDYVLPSVGIEVIRSGVWTKIPSGASAFPSDHWPVFVDIGAKRRR